MARPGLFWSLMPLLIAVQPMRYDGVLYAPGTTFEPKSEMDAFVLKGLHRATDAPIEIPANPTEERKRLTPKRSDAVDAE